MAEAKICTVKGCGKPFLARGWCRAHYLRWRKYGEPEGESARRRRPLKWLLERLCADSDECLLWPFGRTGMGYAALYPDGERQVMAHRWVCERVHGPQPDGKPWVAHSCGNGHLGCVNPRHLRWATPKENGEDRVAHGKAPRGSGHLSARLSETEALAIYALKGSVSHREAARRFGVTHGAVSAIWAGRAWAWLTGAAAPA